MVAFDIVKQVLVNRGLTSEKEQEGFLYSGVSSLSKPFELPRMREACQLLQDTLLKGEKIFVYGDGDVDGVSASFLLVSFLYNTAGGFNENDWYLTHRLDETYEIEDGVIDYMVNEGYSLLISADCGTSSIGALKKAEENGIRCIILDHHMGDLDNLPSSHIYVNPFLYPEWHDCAALISGAGVVFKFIQGMELLVPGTREYHIGEYLEIVAIATLADYLPLTGENRIFVREGLKRLSSTDIKGLAYLIKYLDLKFPLEPADVSMKLNPRLNSPGRLGKPRIALSLMLEKDESEIYRLIREIVDIDRERYKSTVKGIKKVEKSGFDRNGFIISSDISPGVCGIIASRFAAEYGRPVLVGYRNGTILKGSIRAPQGYNLFESLKPVKKYMLSLGGHNNAMGFKFSEEHLKDVEHLWNEIRWHKISDVSADTVLDIEDLTPSLINEIHAMLKPYGKCNQPPLFLCTGVSVQQLRNSKSSMRSCWIKKGNTLLEAFFKGDENIISAIGETTQIYYTPYAKETNGLYKIRLDLSEPGVYKN